MLPSTYASMTGPSGNQGLLPCSGYTHFKRRPPLAGRSGPIIIVVGGGGAVYYFSHIEEIPYTHRRHVVFVSPQTEIQLGIQTFAQVSPAPLSSPLTCCCDASQHWEGLEFDPWLHQLRLAKCEGPSASMLL